MSKSEQVEDDVVNTAKEIAPALSEPPEQLSTELNEWVDNHGLGRANEAEVIVARQSAFNVLLKACLYKIYLEEGVSLPTFEPNQYLNIIERAAVATDDQTLRPYFLDRLATHLSTDDMSRLWESGEQLLTTDRPAEIIGKIHEQLVPQADRRKLGQFRTPPVIADLMAEWVIRRADDTVLDPGIGGGVLSVNAYQAKQHRDGDASLNEIRGVDISELSVLMGNTSLRLANGGGCPHLLNSDFLQLTRDEDLDTVNAVICNPPYSRHHELGQEYKQRINQQMENEAGHTVSSLSPLYSYFYIHASQFLEDSGRMTFITPSEYLETNYGQGLKQFLLDHYHIRAFLLYDRNESMFDEAMTTSCVSFLERKSDDEDDDEELTKFIRVDNWPGREEILNTIENGKEGERKWGFVNTIRQRDLEPEDKWDDLFDPLEIGEDDRLVPLSAIGNVDRGIATGKNDFFCLSESDRRGEANEYKWDIGEEFLSPLVRSSRNVPYYDYRDQDWEQQRVEGEEVWLLYHLDDLDWDPNHRDGELDGNTTIDDYLEPDDGEEKDEDVEGVVQYLQYGMTDDVGADDTYLARNRRPWYVVDRREPAPILYTYMSRSRGRFVHNKTEARNLNNLHSIYLDVELCEEELAALLGYLNSEFADTVVKRSGRTYSTGMDKVEPAELEDVPILNPKELNDEIVHQLAESFDELCEAARNDAEEEVRRELDRLLNEELDI